MDLTGADLGSFDDAECIDVQHLVAAQAVWNYGYASAQYVFGESLGDPNAQRFLDKARDVYPEGLDGAAQDRATNDRWTAAIRESLVKQGLIRVEAMQSETLGKAHDRAGAACWWESIR